MGRFIGVRHRVKRTADGEARPTEVCILGSKKNIEYKFESEEEELDFVRGRFVVKMRKVKPDDDVSAFAEHHVEWRDVRTNEELDQIPKGHIMHVDPVLVAFQVVIKRDDNGEILKRRKVAPDEDLSKPLLKTLSGVRPANLRI